MGETKKKKTQETSKKQSRQLTPMQKVKRFLKSKLLGFILAAIHLIATVLLLGEILYLNVLPAKFFIPISFVLLLLVAYTFLTVYSKKFRTFGKVLSVIFTVFWCVGIYYVGSANGMFDSIAGSDTKTDVINVYVLKDDTAESLKDTKDYTFGVLAVLDSKNTEKTISKIESEVGQEIATKEYEHWSAMIDALYSGEVGAIILNSAYIDSATELDEYADFESKTKVIHENVIVTKIDVDTEKDVTNSTFVLYISGIDVTGKISTTSRSDVNIIAVVNPKTRQVLMVNTPRDYYIPLAMDGSPMDKLTHAGIYGIDMSMNTLGNLYDIKMDYYFRINFTGFEKVIDALGGIEVYSESEFTTRHGNYHIVKGTNYLDGKEALGFVRERYALADGDNQRGRNQMAVIKAIINKMASSALLNDFSGLMDSLEGSFQTSMTSEQISSLVRMQLDEGGSWNVVNYSVTGTGDSRNVYSMSSKCYVMIPNDESVAKAKELIQMVYDGKTITDEDLK